MFNSVVVRTVQEHATGQPNGRDFPAGLARIAVDGQARLAACASVARPRCQRVGGQ